MTREEIIRAWRDEDYRLGLSPEQQAEAAHPAGTVEVLEELLDAVAGGQGEQLGAARSLRVRPHFMTSGRVSIVVRPVD
jgi:mersacidin/lichenicidin family type 2 lantibiotic